MCNKHDVAAAIAIVAAFTVGLVTATCLVLGTYAASEYGWDTVLPTMRCAVHVAAPLSPLFAIVIMSTTSTQRAIDCAWVLVLFLAIIGIVIAIAIAFAVLAVGALPCAAASTARSFARARLPRAHIHRIRRSP